MSHPLDRLPELHPVPLGLIVGLGFHSFALLAALLPHASYLIFAPSLVVGTMAGFAQAHLRRLRRSERELVAQHEARMAWMRRRDHYLSSLVEIERMLLGDEDGDDFRNILPLLGQVSEASRVAVFQNQTEDSKVTAMLVAEWCALGIASQIDNPIRTDLALSEHFPRWVEQLGRNNFLAGDIGEFPDDERQHLELQGIFALVLLPLVVDNKLWGFVSLEKRYRATVWDKRELDLLRTASQAMVQAQDRRNNERATREEAMHDALTGLSNRRRLREQLERSIEVAQRNHTAVVVLYLDLDRFKQINDTLGHAFGDRFLQYVVKRRLIPCIGKKDLLARVGGDEFVLVMSEIDHPDIVNGAARMAESLLRALTEPIYMEGQELVISTSIGISRYPTDAQDADSLLKNSDVAMYRAKEEGRGDFRFFTPQMNRATKERFEIEADLRHDLTRATKSECFQLFFQPQVDLQVGRMLGVESLIRWKHARRGLVSPAKFIPIAEETGLIRPLAEWVLDEATQYAARWSQQGRPLRVAINLSAQQLRDRELPRQVEQLLARTHLPPELLDLELTETALLEDIPSALTVMNALKQMGVCLSLDDFGAGYSSLSHLRHCPFDVVKIDRSFVKAIVGSVRDQMVVKMLIGLAHDLGMSVVAEGVETTAQCDILFKLGCHHFQGFLFSPPVSSDELERRFLFPDRPAVQAA